MGCGRCRDRHRRRLIRYGIGGYGNETVDSDNAGDGVAGLSDRRTVTYKWSPFIRTSVTRYADVAAAFSMIAKVEAEHERRYLKLLQNVSEDKVFMKEGKVWWKCINCGYVYESVKALEKCPACLHPKAFMQVREENY
jgi:rubrerythrin